MKEVKRLPDEREEFQKKAEQTAERLNKELEERRPNHYGHISHLVAELLEEANKEIEGFGVEGELNEERGVDVQYINMGDAYNLTVLYDANSGKFLAGTWGNVVEEQEREHERQLKEPTPGDVTPKEGAAQVENSPQAPVKSVLDEIDWPKPRNRVEEFRQEFTKKIISLMEQGNAFWQKPWTAAEINLPVNAASGKRYNGVNIAYLLAEALDKGYADPRWMTYKQAMEKGCQVRRGEHGTKIEYYGEYDPKKTKKGMEILNRKIQEMYDRGASPEEINKAMEKASEEHRMLYCKTYTVFNASQIEGLEPLETKPKEEFHCHDRAEAILNNCGVPIRYGMDGAYYTRSQDFIGMPNRDLFKTSEHFYSTALHEVAHSTGHPSRMNREDLGTPFGSTEYAMEELRAEMASAFVFQEIEMSMTEADMEEHVMGHAGYTRHWLGTIKDDYREFYKAVRDATKIADYMIAYEKVMEKSPNIREEGEISEPVPPVPEEMSAARDTDFSDEKVVKQAPMRQSAINTDPVRLAKELIGPGTLVTNAQGGQTYVGELFHIGDDFAIQKIGPGRAILHNLTKMEDPEALKHLSGFSGPQTRVSISYDRESTGSLKTPRGEEEERETAATR